MDNKIKAALQTEKLFLPSYVKKFQCQQCGCCCVNKWNIYIDLKTIERAKRKYAELGKKEEINSMLKENEQGQITMRFNQMGKCKALRNDGRCQWQLDLGYEYLSDVCKVYPRVIFASPRGLEFSLTFSCPAAAAALKQDEPVTFTLEEAATSEFFFMRPGQVEYYLPERLPATDIKTHYFLIEAGLIRIVQDRSYTIGERLILIGRTLGRLAALNGSVQTEENVIATLASYKEIITMEKNYELHLQTLQKVFEALIQRHETVRESLKFLLKAVLLTDENGTSTFWDRVESEVVWFSKDKYEKLVQKCMSANQEIVSLILENYFVNFIFKKSFYQEDWQQVYFKMALLHGLIQFITVCLHSWKEEKDLQEVLLLAIIKVDFLVSHSSELINAVWADTQTLTNLERHMLVFNLAKS